MNEFINLTPHAVAFQAADGGLTVFPASGTVARVSATVSVAPPVGGMPTVSDEFGPVEGLPAPREGVVFIVSGLVLSRPEVEGRADVIAPATGPADAAVRDAAGRITAVTRWKRPAPPVWEVGWADWVGNDEQVYGAERVRAWSADDALLAAQRLAFHDEWRMPLTRLVIAD